LRKLDDEDEEDVDKEELIQQLADKNSELQRLRDSLVRLEQSHADKDQELKQLRNQYLLELEQTSNNRDVLEKKVRYSVNLMVMTFTIGIESRSPNIHYKSHGSYDSLMYKSNRTDRKSVV